MIRRRTSACDDVLLADGLAGMCAPASIIFYLPTTAHHRLAARVNEVRGPEFKSAFNPFARARY